MIKSKSFSLKNSLLCLGMAAFLAGCSQPADNAQNQNEATSTQDETAQTSQTSEAQNPSTVTIATARGEVSLPFNPHPVVVYDMSLLQDLAALGVAVDGIPDKLLLDNFLAKDIPEPKTMGTLFEPDLEALNGLSPKAILVGSRMAAKYDELTKIAPTVDLSFDTNDMYESSKQRLADLGKLFGKEEEAKKLQQDIDDAVAKAKAASEGQGNALVILVSGNKLAANGENSRFGYVHKLFGFEVADPNIEDARHGQPISFEYIQKIDPDWLFVIDRGSAIGMEGEAAQAVLDNPVVAQTKAWKNNHVVYLSPDSYLAFGGYYQWMKDANTVADSLSKAKNTPQEQ